MTFIGDFSTRSYPAIVRDLLTVMTGGTIAEVHPIGDPIPDLLALHAPPVRRISHLEGFVQGTDEQLRSYRFTERDFELVAADDNPDDLVAIRFRRGRPKPAPNSHVTVNYYPLRQRPTPLTDVNVGSVARTLIETVARELATQYAQLQLVYESGFVGTASGRGLDNVVALVGVERLKQGHAVGKVRFSRRSGAPGAVFIPINTAISDGEGQRYLTSHDVALQPNQASVEAWVHGATQRIDTVDGGRLTVLERLIGGIDRVANDEPTWRATEEERDDQLASRAKRAIHGTGKGTLDALRFGLEALPFVRAVALAEYPDPRVPVPGTLRIDVALSEDNSFRRRQVDERITELRPAGIYVERSWAGQTPVQYAVSLQFAGSTQPSAAIADVQDGIRQRLTEYTQALGPGAVLRRARVLSLVLGDERTVDAAVTISVAASVLSVDAFTLPEGTTAAIDPATGVQFSPPTFERATHEDTFALVRVDVELVVQALKIEPALVEQKLKPILGKLLGTLQPGQLLTFQDVADAVRDDASYVLRSLESLIAFDEEGGGFSEVRAGDEGWPMRPSLRLELRKLRVVPGTESGGSP